MYTTSRNLRNLLQPLITKSATVSHVIEPNKESVTDLIAGFLDLFQDQTHLLHWHICLGEVLCNPDVGAQVCVVKAQLTKFGRVEPRLVRRNGLQGKV